MKNALTLTAIVAIVVFGSLSVFGDGIEPLTVSPGATDRLTGVEVRCPTFSWQAVPGAVGYEVVVYQLPPETELAAWSLDGAAEVLFVELPSGVTVWTPSLERGLARGADHVWFVRGVLGDGGADGTSWSQARFFRVVGASTQTDSELVAREEAGHSGSGSGTGSGSMGARSGITEAGTGRSAMEKRVGEKNTKDVGTAMAAIRGEMPDATGETYGVVGTSNSPDGAGLGAVNTAGGPDLVLDGVEDGESDTLVSQDGIRRSSAGVETFTFENTGGGDMHLGVIGTIHGNGSGLLEVDAETLDGIDSSAFSPLAHFHDDRYYTETELNTSGAGGSVHWDNLGSAPAGFADGVDDDTTYTAGTGMELVGTEFRAMGAGYANVVVVAASGGDFTSIQAAIDSISDASASNPYLVWVAPGTYNEAVRMTPHVHLQGAGQEATVITSAVGGSTWPLDVSTLRLASDSTLRDLTVDNTGSDQYNSAVVALSGTVRTVVADVTARARGLGTNNWAIVATGAGTEIALKNVTSESQGGSGDNIGLRNDQAASTTLIGGSYSGDGGTYAAGVFNTDNGSVVVTIYVAALGENGSSDNHGLSNSSGATATLRGGSFTADGVSAKGIDNFGAGSSVVAFNIDAGACCGNIAYGLYSYGESSTILRGGAFEADGLVDAFGIHCDGSGTMLDAVGVSATAEGSANVDGLRVYSGGSAVIRDGLYSARGGDNAHGIGILDSNSTLDATGVTALGENGSTGNYGLYCYQGAECILQGGSFTGRGGELARGLYSADADSILEATSVRALGVDGSNESFGLFNLVLSSATLHGGWFVGSGGETAVGIYNGGNATLEASNVAARGDGCTNQCIGLYNRYGADGLVFGGYFIGSGGGYAYGIINDDSSPTLKATGVTARGENGSTANWGIRMASGDVALGNSQLWNPSYRGGGTLLCYGVFDQNFASYSCP